MEQVLFEQHARLVSRVKSVLNRPMRKSLEIATFLAAFACAISLFILHVIYVTNSSNSNVNCLMTYFDAQNITNPGHTKHQYDLIKLTVLNATSYPEVLNTTSIINECAVDSCSNFPYTSKAHTNDKVYLFSMDRGSLMLADDTMKYHNFSMLEIEFPSHASCFGPPLTSRVIKEYLGYDLIVLNWAVAAFEGEGYMYKVENREVYNLNFAGDFVSKKGSSLIGEKNSVRFKDPLALPTLIAEHLSNLGIGEKALDLYHLIVHRASELWVAVERVEALRPVTDQLKWAFSDEFDATSASGSTVNSMLNLLHSAYMITNTRWKHLSESVMGLNQYLSFRLGVVFTTTFLFFVTTTLVSYTLRETQERMLRFTHQLQHHINNDLPYWTLVFTHLVESLVFVPIIMGIHFFLVEFFSDQLLAFMVLLMVWMGEVFSVLSLRSRASIRFFPKLFCAYFYLFHIYFFCFPYGFSYLAWATAMLFILHATMHLMNSYEIPAFEVGFVNARTPRAGLFDPDALAAMLAEEDAAAVALGNANRESRGAVFRRMQALRRAAEAAGLAGGRRSRASRARLTRGSDDQQQQPVRVGAAGARDRTSSHDIPKSKFALAPIPPRQGERSTSTGPERPVVNVRPANYNNRGPVLAMGRSDSMAQYMEGNFMDEEAALDAELSGGAQATKVSGAKAVKTQVKSPTTQKTGPNGDTIVIQKTDSADSDFGLQIDGSDEERQVRNKSSRNDGMSAGEEDEETCSSNSDYYSEEQEEEERRFFVFGAVTGASDATSGSPDRHARTDSTEGTPVGSSSRSGPRKHRHRRNQADSSAMKPSTAPNIYETLDARRARLRYQAVGGSTAATEEARLKAEQLSRPGARVDGSLLAEGGGANTIEGSSSPAQRKKKTGNKESLSDYGFKSSDFSELGEVLRN